jgi:hydrogenase expression/formation protein HypC
MCLALPGKLIEIIDKEPLLMGRVDCNGVIQKVCIAFTPDAQIGCYLIVHVGFAISILNEEEAKKTLSLFEEIQ